jgi:hypothetical protein
MVLSSTAKIMQESSSTIKDKQKAAQLLVQSPNKHHNYGPKSPHTQVQSSDLNKYLI